MDDSIPREAGRDKEKSAHAGPPFLIDRSGAELDDQCGQAFWWNRLEGKRGIMPRAEAAALQVGREIHEDLATIAVGPDVSPDGLHRWASALLSGMAGDEPSQQVLEFLYRRLGWVVAFALFVEPTIRETFENVLVEGELILDRSPLLVATTPDRILRHRQEGYLVYREYKSTISAGPKWMDSWAYAPQLHTGMAAVSEEFGEPVRYAQVMGLLKGTPSYTDGRLLHPFVWGYYNEKTGGWTSEYENAKSSGWRPMPVWEYPRGVVAWITEVVGREAALAVFPHTAPVFYNARLLEDWIRRRTHREQVIAAVKEECRSDPATRAIYFERRTRSCRPAFGDACPYRLACWNAVVEANPLASEDYIERVPHHEIELTGAE